jgi:hypothetical protein
MEWGRKHSGSIAIMIEGWGLNRCSGGGPTTVSGSLLPLSGPEPQRGIKP